MLRSGYDGQAGYGGYVANRFQFALPDPRQRDGWTRVGNLDLTTTALLVLGGIASMFLWAISKSAVFTMMFHPTPVREGELWRLATWPLANPPTEIWVVITLARDGEEGEEIAGFAGLARSRPGLAAPLTLFLLSLAGIPGTAGFMGKFHLVAASL